MAAQPQCLNSHVWGKGVIELGLPGVRVPTMVRERRGNLFRTEIGDMYLAPTLEEWDFEHPWSRDCTASSDGAYLHGPVELSLPRV